MEIPETVDSIGYGAFAECNRLKSANIPQKLRTLNSTFIECDSLTTIYYNAENAVIGEEEVYWDGARPFRYCRQLKNVVFGENVESIPSYLFYESTVASIEMPATSSLTTIGKYAFAYCKNLREVTVPKGVRSLIRTFQGCDTLNTLYYNAVDAKADNAFEGCKYIKKIVVGAEVESIDLDIRGLLSSLPSRGSSVEFKEPSSLRYLDDSFYNTLWRSNLPEGVNYVGKVAVAYVLPSSSSADAATNDSVQEDTVEIKDGTVCVAGGFSNFRPSKSLQGPIHIPQSVTAIGPIAFASCRFKEITFPDNVSILRRQVLCRCSSLETITLPKNLKEVDSSFIDRCNKVKDIYCPAIEPASLMNGASTFKSTFGGIINPSDINLHVYPESYSAYCTAVGWKDFNIVADLDKVMGIANTTSNENGSAVVVTDGAITVNGSSDTVVRVFSVDGQCVYNGGTGRIGVSPGLYVVNVGGKAQKVIVK